MDRQSVYTSHVYEPSFGQNEDTRLQLQKQLENFILEFRHDNDYVYRCAALSPFSKPFFLISVPF